MAVRTEDILEGNEDSPSRTEAAKQETTAVAQSAVDGGKDVVHEAAAQVSAVATDAKEQFTAVAGQVKDEMRSQLDARGQQAAEGLRTLSTQLSSLAQGRPQESGRVGELVTEAQQRIQTYADSLQQRGPQAIVDDLTAFARRRPVVFLAAATIGGFAFGRLVRGGAEANKQSATHGQSTGIGVSTGSSIAGPQPQLELDRSSRWATVPAASFQSAQP